MMLALRMDPARTVKFNFVPMLRDFGKGKGKGKKGSAGFSGSMNPNMSSEEMKLMIGFMSGVDKASPGISKWWCSNNCADLFVEY